MHVIFDSARHVKVDEQGYLPYIAQTATERVVHDEDALRRLTIPTRRSRAELGDDLLTRGLTHVLVQSQGFNAVAGSELVGDSLDGINRRGVNNLLGGSCRGQLQRMGFRSMQDHVQHARKSGPRRGRPELQVSIRARSKPLDDQRREPCFSKRGWTQQPDTCAVETVSSLAWGFRRAEGAERTRAHM